MYAARKRRMAAQPQPAGIVVPWFWVRWSDASGQHEFSSGDIGKITNKVHELLSRGIVPTQSAGSNMLPPQVRRVRATQRRRPWVQE